MVLYWSLDEEKRLIRSKERLKNNKSDLLKFITERLQVSVTTLGIKSMLCRMNGTIKRLDSDKIPMKAKKKLLEGNNNWFDSMKEIYLFFLYLEEKFERKFLLEDDALDADLYYEVEPIGNFRVYRVCQRLLVQTVVDTKAVLLSWARLMLDTEFKSKHEDIMNLKNQITKEDQENTNIDSENNTCLNQNALENLFRKECSFISVAEKNYFDHFDQSKSIRFKI